MHDDEMHEKTLSAEGERRKRALLPGLLRELDRETTARRRRRRAIQAGGVSGLSILAVVGVVILGGRWGGGSTTGGVESRSGSEPSGLPSVVEAGTGAAGSARVSRLVVDVETVAMESGGFSAREIAVADGVRTQRVTVANRRVRQIENVGIARSVSDREAIAAAAEAGLEVGVARVGGRSWLTNFDRGG